MSFLRPLLVYGLAAIATTWPLSLQLTSRLGAPVGPGDPFLNLWILGWGMHAFVTDPASVLTGRVFDANIFHPAAGTLTYSDHLLLQSAVLAPLYAVSRDVVLCYNVLLLASLVASALAMHAFVRAVTGSTGGAYLAGLAWGFGSYRFAHLLHLQLQSLYFLPLTFLLLHRVFAGRRWRDALLLGVVYALQVMSSVYYAVIGGVGLVCAGVALLGTAGPRRKTALFAQLLTAVVVGGVLVLPVGVAYWRVEQAEGFGRNLYQVSRGAAYVDSYAQAPAGNVLYGRTGLLRFGPEAESADPARTGPERELFPGVVLVVLAAVGMLAGIRGDRKPLAVAMAALAVAGFVLSLGPDGIRPVYAALHRFVFGFHAMRAPARFSILVTFALAALAAVGWQALVTQMRRVGSEGLTRAVAAALLVLAAAEWLHVPTTLAPAPPRHTEVGEWLRQAPGDGAVAVLPLDLDVGSTVPMVQSLEHRRPLVNGYSGQRPDFYTPLADTLSAFPGDDALQALHDAGVQFVVTERVDAVAPPLVERARFSDQTIYELVWTPDIEARLASRVTAPPPPPQSIPFAVGETARYAVGWGGVGMSLVAGHITTEVAGPPFRFVVTAETAPWVARFFEARDRFVTTTDPLLVTQSHEREQHEGSRDITRAFVYDHTAGVVRVGASVPEAGRDEALTLPMTPYARDAIAALFYARTLSLEPGAVHRVPVNEAGRNLVVDVDVAGRETIQVQGRAVEAVRLNPRIQRQVERRRPVAATIWLSADARRVPLALEIEAPFGRVRAELIGYQPQP